ncbi:MAG: phosphotransferase family protein [Pseudonocardiaceae bacterium]
MASTASGAKKLGFDGDSSRALLDVACKTVGLDSGGAELLRLGANALYRLSDAPVTVRIGRSRLAARKEIRVARWLASHDFPAVRLAENLAQPISIGDVAITFWWFVEASPDPITAQELAWTLRELHRLPAPTDFQLPSFDPMSKVERRLDAVPTNIVPPADIDFLRKRRQQLVADFEALHYTLPFGPVHGDAHTDNLIRSADAADVKLLDFEDFSWGPREWDVSVLAVRYQAFGWASPIEYADYVATYGFDPLNWPGFPVFRAIRELNMTAWLMEKLGESPEVTAEVRRRVADLRDDQSPRRWRIF